jgi:hypothetical protein
MSEQISISTIDPEAGLTLTATAPRIFYIDNWFYPPLGLHK